MPSSDADLALRAQRGDSAAEDELVKRYWSKVDQFALNFTIGGAERGDVESCVLLGLLKAVRSYDPARGTNFSTWANKVIKPYLIDRFRESIRRLPLDKLLSLHFPVDGVDVSDEIADEKAGADFEASEMRDQMEAFAGGIAAVALGSMVATVQYKLTPSNGFTVYAQRRWGIDPAPHLFIEDGIEPVKDHIEQARETARRLFGAALDLAELVSSGHSFEEVAAAAGIPCELVYSALDLKCA